jgi:hypothetical protein
MQNDFLLKNSLHIQVVNILVQGVPTKFPDAYQRETNTKETTYMHASNLTSYNDLFCSLVSTFP